MGYKIAITGAGGGVGQSIIKSLYNTDYELIALDGEILGAGLYSTPTSYLIPYSNHPDYISELLNICFKEKIDLLFPGLDIELEILAKNIDKFSKIGTKIVVSSLDVINISNNKQHMFDCLKTLNINVPKTFSFPLTETFNFPFIIKQKVDGARSKNVFLIRNQYEYDNVISQINNNLDNFILQEYIDGDEYTCGTINLNQECKGVIVMKRILRDGDTYKCFSIKDDIIENFVKQTVNAIKPFGACNIQLRLKDGIPYIFEINARCSGTTASRTICGFNEPKMIADYILKGIEPKYNIKELTILRYWNELIVDNKDIELMKTQKYLTNIQTKL